MQSSNLEPKYTVYHAYIEESNVLIRSFRGEVDMDGILKAWKDDIATGIVSTDLNAVITDFIDCNNTATYEDRKRIMEYYLENPQIFTNFKIAVVIDAPRVVAITTTVEAQTPVLSHKTFTTLEAAKYWASH